MQNILTNKKMNFFYALSLNNFIPIPSWITDMSNYCWIELLNLKIINIKLSPIDIKKHIFNIVNDLKINNIKQGF